MSDYTNEIDHDVKKLIRGIRFSILKEMFYFHPPTLLMALMTLSTYFVVKDPAFVQQFQLPPAAASFLTDHRTAIINVMMIWNGLTIFNASVKSMLPGLIALIVSFALLAAGANYYALISLTIALVNVVIFRFYRSIEP